MLVNFAKKYFILFWIILFPVVSFSEDRLRDISNSVESIRKDLNDLQKHVYRGNVTPRSNNNSVNKASAIADIDGLEEKMRKLNGKLEEFEYKIENISKKVNSAIADFDQRLNNLEHANKNAKNIDLENKPIDLMPGNVEDKVGKISGQENESKLDASATYEQAFSFLRAKRYKDAEESFKQFITRFPENSLASNATYWLAETFYVRENYPQSAVYFLKTYQNYPSSGKAVDSLIKLAAAMNNLGKNKEACATLRKAKNEYPKAPKDTISRIDNSLKKC